MDPSMAKKLLWHCGTISTIIGLIIIIINLMQKGEPLPEKSEKAKSQKMFFAITWITLIIVTALLTIIAGRVPGRTGIRGAIFFGYAGFALPILLSSIESLILSKNRDRKAIPLILNSSTSLGGLGISMLFMSFISIFYGIRAVNVWMAFILGISLALFLLKLSSGMIRYSDYELISSRVDIIFYIIIATVTSTVLAGYHFSGDTLKAFMPLFFPIALFFITIVCTAPFMLDKVNPYLLKVLPYQLLMFLILFIGFTVFFINRLHTGIDYIYPLMAGAITGAFLLIILQSTYRIKTDLASGAFATLMILGGLWFAFKTGQGFGITLYSIGLLSLGAVVSPHGNCLPETDELTSDSNDTLQIENMDNIPEVLSSPVAPEENTGNREWAGLFFHCLSIVAILTLIPGIFRAFIQSSPLLNQGIDFADINNMIAFLLGCFLCMLFDGFGINRHRSFQRSNTAEGIIKFFITITALLISVFCMGILFRLEGLGAFSIGLMTPSFINLFLYFMKKREIGIFKSFSSALWLTAGIIPLFLINLRNIPDEMTRQQKMYVLTGCIIFITLYYVLTEVMAGRTKQAKER